MGDMRDLVNEIVRQWNHGLGPCERCPYNRVRLNPDFALGSERAKIMVVAQNPGKPGRRGRRPTRSPPTSDDFFEAYRDHAMKQGWRNLKVMEAMTSNTPYSELKGLYYTNVVKCHSYDRENHRLGEAAFHCKPYLEREVELLRPGLIITFGKVAYEAVAEMYDLLRTYSEIIDSTTRLRTLPRSSTHLLVFEHWGRQYGSGYRRRVRAAFVNALKKLNPHLGSG